MPFLETFLTGLAVRGVYDVTKEGATRAYNAVLASRPDLVEAVDVAAKTGDDAALRDAISGALGVAAATGHVAIQGALISALGAAKFDHEQGTMLIEKTTIKAGRLVTGGGAGSTGKTVINGGTKLSTNGTSIDIGQGASIIMTGGARIEQT